MRGHLHRTVVPFLLLVAVGLLSHRVDGGEFDWQTFRAATEEDKLKTVVDALDARDRSLQNVAYKVQEACVNIRKDTGARHYIRKETFELRRLNEALWIRYTTYDRGDPNGKVREEWEMSWDGKVNRIVPVTDALNHSAIVETKESERFSTYKYNLMLGVRFAADNRFRTVVQWLRDAIQSGADIRVDEFDYKGIDALHLDVQQKEWRREFWLDPQRGFMIIAAELVFANHLMGGGYEVTAADQIAGGDLCIPRQVVGRQGTRRDKEQSEFTYDLQEFTVAATEEGDMSVASVQSSKVFDYVRHICYCRLPDGRYRLFPLYDQWTGYKYYPPEDNVVRRIDDETANLYRSERVGTLEEQLREEQLRARQRR